MITMCLSSTAPCLAHKHAFSSTSVLPHNTAAATVPTESIVRSPSPVQLPPPYQRRRNGQPAAAQTQVTTTQRRAAGRRGADAANEPLSDSYSTTVTERMMTRICRVQTHARCPRTPTWPPRRAGNKAVVCCHRSINRSSNRPREEVGQPPERRQQRGCAESSEPGARSPKAHARSRHRRLLYCGGGGSDNYTPGRSAALHMQQQQQRQQRRFVETVTTVTVGERAAGRRRRRRHACCTCAAARAVAI